jgi:hypothetical protein
MSDTQDVEALVARLEIIAGSLKRPGFPSNEAVVEIQAAAAALRTLARERDEARELFGECQEARDAAGYLGPVPDCIRDMDARASSLEAQLAGVKEALGRAIDDIEHWGSYAREYFQQKHDLAGDIARARAVYEALASAPASAGVGLEAGETREAALERALLLALGRLKEIAPNEDAGAEFDALMARILTPSEGRDGKEVRSDHSGQPEGFLTHMLAEITDENRHSEFPPATPEASHDR